MKNISEMDELDYEFYTNYKLFNFEKNFDLEHTLMWMKGHFPYCFLYCTLYAILIFGGKRYMSNRPKYDLRRVLTLWSASLALFSIIAVYRTLPVILHLLRHRGFHYTTCAPSIKKHSILYYWSYLFTLSKLAEFGDTFFIVLRKQPLIFLHWYHHIATFLYGWLCYTEETVYVKWFALMNSIVHSCMYTYYSFKAMGYGLPNWIAMTITSIQLSQMFVGIFIAMLMYYYVYIAKIECHVTSLNITVVTVMYISYAILFARFYIQSYLSDKPAKNFGKKTDVNSKLKAT